MYATCLFCNSALGANESIEHFPVGRRLAYDAAKGRLWVLCKKCERWNLSPLETRWEAIEEAERAFRGTKLRVSTDNIGLAQLRDGTELVRIGAPPKLELAAWRYGNQFGRRQRRFLARFVPATILGSVVGTALPAAMLGVPLAAVLGGGILGAASVVSMAKDYRDTRSPHFALRDANGVLRRFSADNARRATLGPAGHAFEWQLCVPYQDVARTGALLRMVGIKELGSTQSCAILRNDAAIRALASVLPHANMMGGGKGAVKSAVQAVNDAPNLQYLLHQASVAKPSFAFASSEISKDEVTIFALPAELRLALEMAIHDSDERRAMEGELHELEQRWKEADAIAKIADEMFLPENIADTLATLRSERGTPSGTAWDTVLGTTPDE
ncbi:MAG: hypothetical protein ABI120_04445 [Gemmatimonadaceae bacterium]